MLILVSVGLRVGHMPSSLTLQRAEGSGEWGGGGGGGATKEENGD